MFRKGSGDFSFAEVLPCEQLARCFSTTHLKTDMLKSQGKLKPTVFIQIIEVT